MMERNTETTEVSQTTSNKHTNNNSSDNNVSQKFLQENVLIYCLFRHVFASLKKNYSIINKLRIQHKSNMSYKHPKINNLVYDAYAKQKQKKRRKVRQSLLHGASLDLATVVNNEKDGKEENGDIECLSPKIIKIGKLKTHNSSDNNNDTNDINANSSKRDENNDYVYNMKGIYQHEENFLKTLYYQHSQYKMHERICKRQERLERCKKKRKEKEDEIEKEIERELRYNDDCCDDLCGYSYNEGYIISAVRMGYGNTEESRNDYYYHNLSDPMILNRKTEENRRVMLCTLFYNMDYDCITKQHSNDLTQLADTRQNEERQRMRSIRHRPHRYAQNQFGGDNNYRQQRCNLRAVPEPSDHDPNYWKDGYDALFEFYNQTFERVDFKQTEESPPMIIMHDNMKCIQQIHIKHKYYQMLVYQDFIKILIKIQKAKSTWHRMYKLKLKYGLNQVYQRGKYFLYEILESEPNSQNYRIELFRYSIFNNLLKANKILQQIQIQTQVQIEVYFKQMQHIQILINSNNTKEFWRAQKMLS